ncbi:MAG: DUF1249 domain-containing protein [Lysobacteraceae bacterium]|jgi:uncharacterized protein YqiB (DUF1249 family)|nr:DUF1249 domain-containing protein [Xanthomonadaceae bacterium]MCZ8317474.1 DUF1249 domain-containing protein [Silanimonas sp.]
MRQNRPTLPYPAFGRFAWLMELYGESYQRLERMFGPGRLEAGHYVSSVGDGLDLHVEVLERHAHTVELRLSYALRDPVTGRPDPSAVLRTYLDSRQVEATTCHVGRRWQDALGLEAPPKVVMGHRLRMNSFLSKWLAYLEGLGHGPMTLRRADADDHEESALAEGA